MLDISDLRSSTNHVAKTKALISSAVTAKLICVFVFAYTKSRFSYDEAHLVLGHITHNRFNHGVPVS